ncbi:site-specific integrase [Paraburkholderia strydomiana]|uniref:site-specific integrase n=1 Tax=Paraburkholderia strydomiana TaxID=1245417 RepID=UPI0038BB0094
MINLTDSLMLTKKKLGPQVIAQAVDRACATAERQLKDTTIWWQKPHRARAFSRFVGKRARHQQRTLDIEFLQKALVFVVAKPQDKDVRALFPYSVGARPAATAFPYLARGLKHTLLLLWNDGYILLPTTFLPGPNLPAVELTRPILEDSLIDGHRKAEYVQHMLRATDWQCVEDISIREAADFLRALTRTRHGTYDYDFTGSPVPVLWYLSEMLEKFPARVRYGSEDLISFSNWSNQFQHIVSFDEYVDDPSNAEEARREISALEKVSGRRTYMKRRSTTKTASPLPDIPTDAAPNVRNDAIVKFISEMRSAKQHSVDWENGPLLFSGREHLKIDQNVLAPWLKSFSSFLYYRKETEGIQRLNNEIATRSILFEYLFCYLPWWQEVFSNSSIIIPTKPGGFTTFPYVSSQTTAGGTKIDLFPMPIRDFVCAIRNASSTRNAIMRCLTMYFDYVSEFLGDDKSVCDGPFKNPVIWKLHSFPEPRPNQTTKVTFPVDIEGHLTMYGYAVESFGEYLLECALETDPKEAFEESIIARSGDPYDTNKLGFVPFYFYRGDTYPIFEIPRVFTWEFRSVNVNGTTETRKIPHLTALRLCLVGNESGHRLQSHQWLPVYLWDEDNSRETQDYSFAYRPTGRYFYDITINTDKTRTSPWPSLIVYRARSMLLREEHFQTSICADSSTVPVAYEGRDNSPFDDVVPLFQSARTGKPISDGLYNDVWKDLLFEFQRYYRKISHDYDISFVYIKPPARRVSIKKYKENEGCKYCEINYLAVQTPHACRATFITMRQGLLETSEISEIVGHRDTIVTDYYTKPTRRDLAKRFASVDHTFLRDFLPLDSECAIRPDKPNSALVKAFKLDRKETYRTFGFMAPFVTWGLDQLQDIADGAVQLLQDGPMSQLIFHTTHICPVGDQCPKEVVEAFGERYRCGLCPLAMKCVDHQPGISAKSNLLVEQIRFATKKIDAMRKAGEPAEAVNRLWLACVTDTNEYLAWRYANETLDEVRSDLNQSKKDKGGYLVGQPDIVKKHLTRVTKDVTLSENLVTRILESNVYPAFSSEALDAKASLLKRRLLSGNFTTDATHGANDASAIDSVASLLRSVARELPDRLEAVLSTILQESVKTPELEWETK